MRTEVRSAKLDCAAGNRFRNIISAGGSGMAMSGQKKFDSAALRKASEGA
jgi:hypothetical protein